MKRPRAYTKVRRAEAERQTRDRIVDALMALHEEVGPAQTTISAAAERAGVERLTVYRHFGDERAMLQACSERWNEQHPAPDLMAVDEDNPVAAVRSALLLLYAWYRANAKMLRQVTRDADRVAAVGEAFAPFVGYLDSVAASLERKWPRRSARRRVTLRHALEFSTWLSLSRFTRHDREAAAIAATWLVG